MHQSSNSLAYNPAQNPSVHGKAALDVSVHSLGSNTKAEINHLDPLLPCCLRRMFSGFQIKDDPVAVQNFKAWRMSGKFPHKSQTNP